MPALLFNEGKAALPSLSLNPAPANFLASALIFAAVFALPNLAPTTGKPTATTPSMFTNAEAGEVMNQIKEVLDRNPGIPPVSVGFIMYSIRFSSSATYSASILPSLVSFSLSPCLAVARSSNIPRLCLYREC